MTPSPVSQTFNRQEVTKKVTVNGKPQEVLDRDRGRGHDHADTGSGPGDQRRIRHRQQDSEPACLR